MNFLEVVRLLMGIISLFLLSAFIPFTVCSFRRSRLRKKEYATKATLKTLGLRETEIIRLMALSEKEYAGLKYALPVSFSTILCILGFIALFYGGGFSLDEPDLLLSGANPLSDAEYRRVSLLALTMAFLGSYIWSLQNLFRRLVTIDLPPPGLLHSRHKDCPVRVPRPGDSSFHVLYRRREHRANLSQLSACNSPAHRNVSGTGTALSAGKHKDLFEQVAQDVARAAAGYDRGNECFP